MISDVLIILALIFISVMLILRPKETADAAKSGVETCLYVVIPSLFPFFVISSLISELGLGRRLASVCGVFMRPLFGLGGGCAFPLVLGLIGGYPVGTKAVTELYKNGGCSKKEAERMLLFCNNSGPAFIFGIVGAYVFGSVKLGAVLYAIHVLSSLIIGVCTGTTMPPSGRPAQRPSAETRVSGFAASFIRSVTGAFGSMLNISGFVIFFSVLTRIFTICGVFEYASSALSALGADGRTAYAMLCGIFELTGGICALSCDPETLRASLTAASFLLGFGGLSVICQMISLLENTDISPKNAIIGKILHGIISAVIAFFVFGIMDTETLASPVFRPAEVSAAYPISPFAMGVTAAIALFTAILIIATQKRYGKNRNKNV